MNALSPWQNTLSWLNASGGLKYHLKALRYRQALWPSHLQGTKQFLESWQPLSQDLVLIGPSAGYSLPEAFLRSFKTVTALDPDPLARRIFKSRWPTLKVSWSAQNYLYRRDKTLWPEGLFYLREEHPAAAILFCNLLGQLPFIVKDFEAQIPNWQKHWSVFLQSGEWASFHDLWSAKGKVTNLSFKASIQKNLDLKESVREFMPAQFTGTVQDHLTKDLFPADCTRSQWLWQIEPGQVHCVEGVRPSKQVSGA